MNNKDLGNKVTKKSEKEEMTYLFSPLKEIFDSKEEPNEKEILVDVEGREKLSEKCLAALKNINKNIGEVGKNKVAFTKKILLNLKKDRATLNKIYNEISDAKKEDIDIDLRRIERINENTSKLVKKFKKIKNIVIAGKITIATAGIAYIGLTAVNSISDIQEKMYDAERNEAISTLSDEQVTEALNVSPDNVDALEKYNRQYEKNALDIDKNNKIDRGELENFSIKIHNIQVEILKEKILKEYLEQNPDKNNENEIDVKLKCSSEEGRNVGFALIDNKRYGLDSTLEWAAEETVKNLETINNFDLHSDKDIVKAQEKYLRSVMVAASKGVETSKTWMGQTKFETYEVTQESIKQKKLEMIKQKLNEYAKTKNENLKKEIEKLANNLGIVLNKTQTSNEQEPEIRD